MRVLIIKTSALGDIIHALPVLDYLHQASPGIHIDWVVEETFQDLLTGNPLIQRLITVAFKRWKTVRHSLTAFCEILNVREQLQCYDYDLVFDLQGNIKSGCLCWLTSSQRKIGFSRVHLQEKLNMLFTTQQVGFRPEDQHTSDRYLRIVSTPFDLIASKLKLATDIYTSPEDDEAANAIIASCAGASPVIHFHCGTTWQTKLWHEQGWIDLATRISADFPSTNILLSWGNPDEHTLVQRVAKGGGEHLVVLERLVLKQFVALLKKVDLVVGGDTGPVHLAATVNTPTVSFYRCTDGARNGPRGERHVIIQSPLECTTCLKKSCERNSECFRSITVDAMYNGVAGLLGRKAEMSLTDTKGMKVC